MHHDLRRMGRFNFNITFPLCDWLFGTVWKPGAQEPRAARPARQVRDLRPKALSQPEPARLGGWRRPWEDLRRKSSAPCRGFSTMGAMRIMVA